MGRELSGLNYCHRCPAGGVGVKSEFSFGSCSTLPHSDLRRPASPPPKKRNFVRTLENFTIGF